jgi:RNA polymerase sigma-70 factor (ECF subfamily)
MVPATHLPEKALIERAQRYEAEAVAELYRRHLGEIYRYCLFRIGDEAAAEDLTEEVFLNMLQGLPRYTDRGIPFVAWLYRIARARVVDYQRQRARRPTELLADSLADAAPGPEAQAVSSAEVRELKRAMARLSDPYQMVLQLRFIEGCGLEETARRMGKTMGAAKVLQHRALRKLAELMEK